MKDQPFQSDERWQLVERISASRGFHRSAYLCGFLRYIAEKQLCDKSFEITEQQIGEQVFGRAPGYSPGEDNIVRNYARLLRRRIEEYFSGPGAFEPLRLQVPRGAYLPSFSSNPAIANTEIQDCFTAAPGGLQADDGAAGVCENSGPAAAR